MPGGEMTPNKRLKRLAPMTIGIGVLASTVPRPSLARPDAIVMMADTMGSSESDSTSELHKLISEEGICASCAGNVEHCEEIISIFKQEVSKMPARTVGSLWDGLNKAVHEHRMAHFKWDYIAARYAFSPQGILESEQKNLVKDWQEYDSNASMLVGIYHRVGVALLFYVGQMEGAQGWVHTMRFPGFCAIGTGSYNANAWLNYRQQQFGMNLRQSAYHAYESRLMAGSAPTVNKNLEILVAMQEKHYFLNAETPEVDGCPISIPELRSLYKKLGPQETNRLGHQTPKADKKRKK